VGGKRALGGLFVALALVACSTELNITPSDGGAPLPDGAVTDGGSDDVNSGPIPTVLAGGQDLSAVAVDGESVYFTQEAAAGAILRVPKTGGAVTTLQKGDLVSTPTAIATAAGALYWVARGASGPEQPGVRRRDAAGAVTHLSATALPEGLSVGASRVFWLLPADETFATSDLLLSSLTPFLSGVSQPQFVAANTTHVYGASGEPSGQVFRSAHGGVNVVKHISFFGPITALAASESTVAVADTAGVSVIPTAAFGTGGGVKVSSVSGVTAIVIDDSRGAVFFLNGAGDLYRRVEGAIPDLLLGPGCKQGRGLAQDADALYLACTDSIVRIPKPK
jgi:hypothetical protein